MKALVWALVKLLGTVLYTLAMLALVILSIYMLRNTDTTPGWMP
jgi:hypothetical protein